MIRFYLTPEAVANDCDFAHPSGNDAGYDLYSNEDVSILASRQKLISTGLYLEIPKGLVGIIKDRSSMAIKRLYVNAGVVDADYRGEVLVALENRGPDYKLIHRGQRIAQMVFIRAETPMVNQIFDLNDLSNTSRGSGGFGSTGE